jgi:TatD DNase family protein
MLRYFDAHNHLQDHRLDPLRAGIIAELPALGLARAVVAGSGEEDWPEVAQLAQQHPWVLPSFGVHPWYVKEQSPDWQERLEQCLRAHPHAGVGEIGLDRWIKDADVPLQTQFFTTQFRIAARDNRAASIHCLRAWGLLEELLRAVPRPERGFLLHSYGGPQEMVEGFARLGAYFSVSPYFLHERKAQQWQTFRHVPVDRLLIETDAPDMWPPEQVNPRPLLDIDGNAINHPANIEFLYAGVAKLRGMSLEELALQVEINFTRLFGIA